MSDYWYSSDKESFQYQEPEELIEQLLHTESKPGDIIEFYCGERDDIEIIEILPDVTEYMGERAYEMVADLADGWPECSPLDADELKEDIAKAVEAWMKKHSITMDFFRVKNVKGIRVKVTDVESIEYEELPPA